MGIDPGTRIMGFGVVRILERKVSYVDMGIIDLRKEGDHFVKLQKITKEITAIIEKYMPDELAVEAPFYGKNPQTMLKLGRAQGAAIAAALLKDIPIFEYAPRSVKLAITGTGAASKDQVGLMVQKQLGISFPQKFADATDALSIALCHAYDRTSIAGSGGKCTTWESFVKNNPEKVKK